MQIRDRSTTDLNMGRMVYDGYDMPVSKITMRDGRLFVAAEAHNTSWTLDVNAQIRVLAPDGSIVADVPRRGDPELICTVNGTMSAEVPFRITIASLWDPNDGSYPPDILEP